jgi:hypothetical protein
MRVGLDEKRMKHMLAVARLMKEMALRLGWGEEKSRQMFVLGYTHDIGYEFSTTHDGHADEGGRLMQEMGFVYADSITGHGKPGADPNDDVINLLNFCDAIIDGDGSKTTPDIRLYNISLRYGKDSSQYKDARDAMKTTLEWAVKHGLYEKSWTKTNLVD